MPLCLSIYRLSRHHFILYTPPDPRRFRFLSLRPISLTFPEPLTRHRVSQIQVIRQLNGLGDNVTLSANDFEQVVEKTMGALTSSYGLRVKDKISRQPFESSDTCSSSAMMKPPTIRISNNTGLGASSSFIQRLLTLSATGE